MATLEKEAGVPEGSTVSTICQAETEKPFDNSESLLRSVRANHCSGPGHVA